MSTEGGNKASVAALGATFLTVHAYPQTMKAAVEARAGSGLKILAVTVLTSYDDSDLHAAGYRLNVSDLVEARARQAQALGVDGLVSSPEEAAALRKIVGDQMNLVTPGIRGKLKTTLKNTVAGADYIWSAGNTLNGYAALASNQVPSTLTKGTMFKLAMVIKSSSWAGP